MNRVTIFTNTDLSTKQGASFARLNNYAHALSYHSVEVHVFSFRNPVKKDAHTIVEDRGVFFHGDSPARGKLVKNLKREFLFWYSVYWLGLLRKHGLLRDTNIIWIPMGFFTDLYSLMFLKYFCKAKIVCEKNELQRGIILNNASIRKSNIFRYIAYPYEYLLAVLQDELVRMYDHVIAISNNSYKWVMKRNPHVSLVPILVDPLEAGEKTQIYHNQALKEEILKIAFFGSINNEKEGIMDFLKLIVNLPSNYEYVFDMYGFISDNFSLKIKNFAEEHSLIDRIRFMGIVSGSEARKLMSGYDLLIMYRDSNIQNEFGQATKLGEYLMSGTAVMVTDVSDNSKYIEDKISGLLVRKESPSDVIRALIWAFDHKSELFELGIKGQQVALSKLSYKKHSKKLLRIFSSNIRCDKNE